MPDISKDERASREKMMIDRSGGISPIYEVFYIEAIIYSAGRAKDAFDRLDRAVQNSGEAAIVVAIAHEALSHVAALSRFFWPVGKKSLPKARAQKLRKAFELESASPLSDRALRNALEHFDERLDEFLLQDLVGQHFFPGPIVGAVSSLGGALGSVFRFLDPAQDVFVLLGERYPFGPLRQVVVDVLARAQKMDREGGRLLR